VWYRAVWEVQALQRTQCRAVSEVQALQRTQCRGALAVQEPRPMQCRAALEARAQPVQCHGGLAVQAPQPVQGHAALEGQVLQPDALQARAPSEVEPLEAGLSMLPVLLGKLPDSRRSLLKVLRLWGPAEGLI